MKWTLERLRHAKESEDRVEFKSASGANFEYAGGSRSKPKERRKCVLGYVTALCNEGGGDLVLGMSDKRPHAVVGTQFRKGDIGQLEADIYRDTGIRPTIYELFEEGHPLPKRVLVISVPPRPFGKVYKFEDVPLARVGEELRPMPDAQLFRILQEQEPDFSEQICEGLDFKDLDENAIRVMRERYAEKQHNPRFLALDNHQILSDLRLLVDGKLTNAALILLGKRESLRRFLPQATVMVEYRATEAQIAFDNRVQYQDPFFLMIDALWHDINLRNKHLPIQEGPYVFEIPYFNEEVIRESINNAIAHRDYRRTSETIIKLYPQRLEITNAGGFPHGVTLETLLTAPSTPRNRLLADVLSKTGLVERSGQGIDKIFYNTLTEGKPEPDYSRSNDFYVILSLSAAITDVGFARFVESEQRDGERLSAMEIHVLGKIRDGFPLRDSDKKEVKKLLAKGLVEKLGRTRGTHYILCKSYYDYADRPAEYLIQRAEWDADRVFPFIEDLLTQFGKVRMGKFFDLLESHMTQRQIRHCIQKLVEQGKLMTEGTGASMRYKLPKGKGARVP